MGFSLTQGLRRAALIRPDATATIDGEQRLSWRQVADRVARLASALRECGLRPGERVAVLALNSSRYFEALFAVPWAGAVAVPVNTRLALPEIDYVLRDSGASYVLADDGFAATLDAILPSLPQMRAAVRMSESGDSLTPASASQRSEGAGWLDYERLISQAAPMDDIGACGDALAGIYYTGGTTGRARGVMLSHTNLVANAMNVIVAVGYSRDTVYLHAPPMFHLADGCSSFGVTMQGGRHVFTSRFDPAGFLALVARERVTDATLVPTMLNMVLSHPDFAGSDLASLERLYIGAAPLPEALIRRAIERLPRVRLQQAWGMTELSPIGMTMEPRFSTLVGPDAGRLRSCGQPVATVEVRIVDAQRREVPRGTVGEIAVRGATVMQGYWNKPEETAQVLSGGWLYSGDAATMDGEGFIYIVDRLKDMIITGGENVYSGEVESVISLVPGVAEVAVIGVPDDRWGERVHAIVVPQSGSAVSAEQVIAFCRERIAAYKCPTSVELRSTPLPLSAANKVLKTELRAPYWQGRDRQVN